MKNENLTPEPRVGVYVCHCGINIAKTVDVKAAAEYAAKLPNVVIARDYLYMCSEPGQELIRKDIKEHKLTRVVVAACSPRMHEPTFRGAVFSVGMNQYLFEMANIREQCSWVHDNRAEATAKAKDLVRSSVARVSRLEELFEKEVDVTRAVMVIGGGVAGIQSALDTANAGFKTYLVEKSPSIGGHMAQLDKTFPTLDCSACILTPKMVDAARHKNIELLAYSEVTDVTGSMGNFKVKVNHKARYVLPSKCTGCDDCTAPCPVSVSNEFDTGLSSRKAIYRPFAQAVPGIFTVDKHGVSPCRTACPAGVNAHGYVALIAAGKYKEALELERQSNPLASICGRVCNHPCESNCNRGKVEKPIAIASLKRFVADYERQHDRELPAPIEKVKFNRIAVVGGGPAGLACAYFLAKNGHPVTIFEALPELGGTLITGIPEFRLPRPAIKSDVDYVLAHGMEVKTGRALGRDFTLDDLFDKGFKAVFLGLGALRSLELNIPGENLDGVYSVLRFLREANLKVGDWASRVTGRRVAVIGGGNAAVDAARTALRLGAKEANIVYRRSRREMPANEWEIAEAEEEGVKITYLAAPTRIIGRDSKVTGIECQRIELGAPDASGRRKPVPIPGSEFTVDTDLVIPAVSQAPETSVVPELESTSWGTLVVNPDNLMTSRAGVFAGGDLVSGPATIIEAVAGGKIAAQSIERYLRGEELVAADKPAPEIAQFTEEEYTRFERQDRTPMSKLPVAERRSFKEVELGFTEEEARAEARRCLNCSICCECMECVRVCQPQAIDLNLKDEVREYAVGAIILATGYDQFDAHLKPEYGFAKYDNVVTGLGMERLLSAGGPTQGEILVRGKPPRDIVFIHCVGSRDKQIGNEYCSRVCCMYIAKQAHLVKERVPGARVTVYYTDVRAFGKGFEEFYDRVKTGGVFYRRGSPSEVFRQGDKLVVRVEDTLLGEMVEHETDMVVLGTGLVASETTTKLANILKTSLSPDRFLMEGHPKMRPVDSTIDGVYLAGCCQGPKDIPDAVAQAKGAASAAIGMLASGKVKVEPAIANVDAERCTGCHLCQSLCPYTALEFDEEKKVMTVNEVLCKGCGVCPSACPVGAIKMRHSTGEQIEAQIEALLEAKS